MTLTEIYSAGIITEYNGSWNPFIFHGSFLTNILFYLTFNILCMLFEIIYSLTELLFSENSSDKNQNTQFKITRSRCNILCNGQTRWRGPLIVKPKPFL